MSVIACYAVPHPPLIVPAVGKGNEDKISKTIEAMRQMAKRVSESRPNAIVIISPHAPAFRDGFFVSFEPEEHGSMAAFGQPQETISATVDVQFANALREEMRRHRLPSASPSDGLSQLDHGAYVPLHFLRDAMDLADVGIVRIGLSGLPSEDHRLLGRLIAKVSDELGRSVAIIASGDWSHKLKDDGPYGFAKEGPVFDSELEGIFESGNLERLFELDEDLCEKAAECGLRSFQIMTGALDGQAYESELLSYEGPFGVGYGVAAIDVIRKPESSQEEAAIEEYLHGTDPLVSLARQTVDQYVSSGSVPSVPDDFPRKYLERKAGVFVSLHERGQLRGCIGTISPQQDCIADEVIANAISASTSDPRFDPVGPEELDHLEYSVDVLGEPEEVSSLVELDPKHYGVIVSRGWKRGLLLPDLEGVDTVMDQIAIAKRKAGIAAGEDVKLERFEVVRHSAGGAPRR